MNEIDKMLMKAFYKIQNIEIGDMENLIRLRYWLGYHDALLELKERVRKNDES